MRKKFVGILVSTLLMITTIYVTGAPNVQISGHMSENNDLDPFQRIPANSPGIINIKIVAKIDLLEDPYNLFKGAIQINDKLTGKYIYDSGVPDQESHPQWGEYWFNSSTYGIELNTGGLIFKTNPSNPCLFIQIANDVTFDQYDLISPNNLQLSNGLLVHTIQMRLQDDSGTAISSDALPTTAPILSDWQDDHYIIAFGYNPSDPNEYFVLGANVTKFTLSRIKTRDVYYNTQPILIWLFERFPNLSPLFKYILRFQ